MAYRRDRRSERVAKHQRAGGEHEEDRHLDLSWKTALQQFRRKRTEHGYAGPGDRREAVGEVLRPEAHRPEHPLVDYPREVPKPRPVAETDAQRGIEADQRERQGDAQRAAAEELCDAREKVADGDGLKRVGIRRELRPVEEKHPADQHAAGPEKRYATKDVAPETRRRIAFWRKPLRNGERHGGPADEDEERLGEVEEPEQTPLVDKLRMHPLGQRPRLVGRLEKRVQKTKPTDVDAAQQVERKESFGLSDLRRR